MSFLSLLLLLSLGLAIAATLHLRMLTAAHLRVARSHLLIVLHLVHRARLAVLTSGLSHFAGVHLRLISSHVLPGALMLVLHFVFVACDFSGSAITCSRTSALPVTLTHISVIVFSFPCSGSRSGIGAFFTLRHRPASVFSFSSSRCSACGACCSTSGADFLSAFPLAYTFGLVE